MTLCPECVKLSKTVSLIVTSKFDPQKRQHSFDHQLSSDVSCPLRAIIRKAFSYIQGVVVSGLFSVRVTPLWQAFDKLSLNSRCIGDASQACCMDRLRFQTEVSNVDEKNETVKTRLATVDLQAFCLTSECNVDQGSVQIWS